MQDEPHHQTRLGPPQQRLGSIDGCDRAASSLWAPEIPSVPLLIAVPHSGRDYPTELWTKLRRPAEASLRLEDRYVDSIATQMATATGASLLLADAPRAMIDLNRSVDDIDWGMVSGAKAQSAKKSLLNRRARNGLGLVPRRIPGLGELWREPLSLEELDRRIATVHAPYHRALGSELERIRDYWSVALLIDLHSMPPLRAAESEQGPTEFVIGDRFGASCDSQIADYALRFISGQGRRVTHNRPYAGGFVLDRYGQPGRSIHAMQIEVCRSTYLDNRLDKPSGRMVGIARLLSGLASRLAELVLAQGGRPDMAQAAE